MTAVNATSLEHRGIVAALQRVDHQMRDGIGLGARYFVAESQRSSQVHEPEADDHQIRDTGENAAGVEARLLEKLTPTRRWVDAQFNDGQRARHCGRGRSLDHLRASAPWLPTLAIGPEKGHCGGYEDGCGRDPYGAIRQQQPRQLRQTRVAVLDGPVARCQVDCPETERIDQRAQCQMLQIAETDHGNLPQNEERDHADICTQQRTGHRRDEKQQSGDE
jgi:hypothetical protein